MLSAHNPAGYGFYLRDSRLSLYMAASACSITCFMVMPEDH
jgi:hypothetical protein